MDDMRVAAVVMQSTVGNIQENLLKTCKWIMTANKLNVSILCFPELNITGYSNNEKISSVSLSHSSKEIKKLSSLSKRTNIVIMVGIVEKGINDKTYITHLVITPNGKIGIYRKIHLSPPEKKIFSNGNSIQLFRLKNTIFGIQLCYDSHFPDLSTCMALKGAEIIFIPHASPRGTAESKHSSWMRHLPARAFDNGIFIIACNQTGNNNNNLSFPGNALILSPAGKIIKKKTSCGEEMIITADLKSKELKNVHQHKMKYFIPNRRPRVYNTPSKIFNL